MVTPPDTVHFLSDYGLRDEFVGVVHATLHRLAPHVRVLDLTHGLRPFDVRGGGWLLARALPHLGPGVVLGVVDPGVGGPRRGVLVQVSDAFGPRWLVGPDNGLLMAAADATGEVELAIDLEARPNPVGSDAAGSSPVGSDAARWDAGGSVPPAGRWSGAVTFDGRDLFAPAAAALCRGAPPEGLGPPIDPGGLTRLPPPVDERGVLADGRQCLRAEVVWVDRFGNVKTSVVVDEALAAALPLDSRAELSTEQGHAAPVTLRAVRTFADLSDGELGALADADGHLAIVAPQHSAALQLDVGVGDLVELWW